MTGTVRVTAAPTLAEVAKLAGVSPKTASRVFNGERYVSADTAERVQRAAELLGFRPNKLAQELRRGARSTLVGMITGDLGNPFYARVASVLEHELREAGYQLVTASGDAESGTEERLAEELLDRRVAALVVVSSASEHHRYIGDGRTPVIFLDRPRTGVAADVVAIDDRAGARMAVRNLLQARSLLQARNPLEVKHERIVIIGDRGQLATHRERLAGFAEALDEAGVTGWECHVRDAPHTANTAKNVVAAVMSHGLPPTALLTTSSLITLGAIKAFHRLHRTAGLIGFDDFELADVLGVTVVDHDVARLAREGARLVLDRLEGSDDPARSVVVPCRLIDRGSADGLQLP